MGITLQKGCLYINKRNVVVLVKDIKHLEGSDAISEIIVLKQGESESIAISPRSWQKDEYKKYGFFVTVKADDSSMGSVTGGGAFELRGESVLTAIPNQGFSFAQWNDGVTDNPRRIKVTQDAEYTAIFRGENPGKEIVITIKANDDTMGQVSGSGKYIANSKIEIGATPNEGYLFVRWNDGSRDNRRIIMPNSNKTYTALFCKEKENVESSGMMNEKAVSKLNKTKNLLIALGVFIGFVALFLSVSLVQSKKRYGEINIEYTTAIRHNKVLIDSLTNLQDDITRKQKTIDSLLNSDSDSLITKLKDELYAAKEMIDELQDTIKTKDERIIEQEASIIELKKQKPDCKELIEEIREKRSEIQELERESRNKNEQIKRLEKQITNENELRLQVFDYSTQLSEAKTEISSLKIELDKKEKKVMEMTKTIKSKDREIETLTNIIKGKK